MAVLVTCDNLSKSYHARPLFEGLTFAIHEGQRLGIVGPNGAGKSTLMRLVAGAEQPDEGLVVRRKGLVVAYVPQVAVFPDGATCRDVVLAAAKGDELEAAMALSLCGFEDTEVQVKGLSGGWQKRLSLAAGIAQQPDVLLLDEPTNHLDLEGVLWLEGFLREAPFAWACVSHDRQFLQRTVTHVVEVSRIYPTGIFVSEGQYNDFLERRTQYLADQAKTAATLANKVKREVEWMRAGVKARTTKSKYRMEEAHALIAELATVKGRREGPAAGIDFVASGRKTKRLVVAEGVAKKLGDRTIVKDLNLILVPNMVVGLAGGNGTGKTTILKLLAGEYKPDAGTVTHADKLKVVYFDQSRDQLDPAKTLKATLSPEGDAVIFQGRSIHVASWARRFNFAVEQLSLPVGELSGGEQARALIARLMLTPADVLLLDEPTNDLDLPTLEALEDSLTEFLGSVVLVSHDRYLIDTVCDVIVGLDGMGGSKLYADREQWQKDTLTPAGRQKKEQAATAAAGGTDKPAGKKLSYKDQREFDGLEAAIAAAEARVADAHIKLGDPAIASAASKLAEASKELKSAEAEVERLYARWAELETRKT
jgi:ATP-binding cassette subfamily F protein uup